MAQPVRGLNPFASALRAPAAPIPAAPSRLEFTYDTKPGNSLEIRGTASGMTWNAGKALTWNEGNRWTMEIPAGTRPFDYKVVFVRKDGAFLFEEGANRTFDPDNKALLKTPTFKEPAADFATLAVKSVAAAGAGNTQGTPQRVRYAYLLPRVLVLKIIGDGPGWDMNIPLTTTDNQYWTVPSMTAGTKFKFGVMDNGVLHIETGPDRVFDPNNKEPLAPPAFAPAGRQANQGIDEALGDLDPNQCRPS